MDGIPVEITARRTVGPATVALELETPPEFEARPGQFVQVRAIVDGETVTRHYSISSPRVTDTFELTVGVDPEGTLSPVLARSEPGETVLVDGPFGRVYYEDEPRVTVLAAGPGIGAAVGIAERARSTDAEVTVIYETDALVHERRLAGLAAAGATVVVLGKTDALETAIETFLDEGQVFVYGFEPFVERAKAALDGVVDPLDAKIENFG